MGGFLTIAVIGLLLAAPLARADSVPGNVEAGRAYAEAVCRGCHSRPVAGRPAQSARSLEAIAAKPGMTGMALVAWLTSASHPTMPNLILSPDEARNVVAYILNLKED